MQLERFDAHVVPFRRRFSSDHAAVRMNFFLWYRDLADSEAEREASDRAGRDVGRVCASIGP